MKERLERAVGHHRTTTHDGRVASYIPELSRMNPDALGAAVTLPDGAQHWAGDAHQRFTMQSISKIVTLMLTLSEHGDEKVFSKVGKEPTGDPFNSIVRLETYSARKPLNPMINAGAIAITSLVPGGGVLERQNVILEFVREITGNPGVTINEAVYRSEKETASRNRALAWFLKDMGVIEGEVEEILDLYFRQCAMETSAVELSRMGAFLAADGVVPGTSRRLIAPRTAKIVKSLMLTCGLYDGSGEFSVSVGLPSKSGVGGGILSVVPSRMGLGVFGPALDSRGNSAAGIRVLEQLSQDLNLSIL